MKILMLTPYVPYPPSSGGQVRTYNLLKYLSKKNKITLVCLYKNEEEKKFFSQLKKYCTRVFFCLRPSSPWQIKNILKAVFSPYPFLVIRNYSNEATTLLKKLLAKEKFDIIHAETFYILPHLPKTKTPVFLLEQTIEYQVYEHFVESLPFFLKPFFLFDIWKLKESEVNFWKKANLVGVVSEKDGKIINEITKRKPVIIPNAAGDEMIVKRLPKKSFKKPVVFFQGNFSWLQNTEATQYLIKKIVPEAIKKIPQLTFIIAGQKAKEKLGQPSNKSLKIIDIKNEEIVLVKKLYKEATIFIAPIFGPGGTRLKILAAMASGIPIISTSIGVSGLVVKDKRHILIASNPKEFIEKIDLLLKDDNLYYQLQKNAYLLIKEKYNWKKIAEKLEVVYQKILHHHL